MPLQLMVVPEGNQYSGLNNYHLTSDLQQKEMMFKTMSPQSRRQLDAMAI